MQRLYDHGLPFSSNLADNLDVLLERIDNKKSALIIVDGWLGEGKTTLMIHILDYINKKRGLPPVDLSGCQVSMGGSEFLTNLRMCYENRLPCIGYDEAGDFNRRGALTGFNAMMNRAFEMFRAFGCLVVIVLPNFEVLDTDLYDKGIPRLLLRLKKRSRTYGNFHGYSLYKMLLIRAYSKKVLIKPWAFTRVWANFDGHFLDLSPERSAELDKVCTKNKLENLKKSEVKIEGLFTVNEIATKLMKSLEWTFVAIKNLKIKFSKKIGRIRYFDATALDMLTEHAQNIREKIKDKRTKEGELIPKENEVYAFKKKIGRPPKTNPHSIIK